MQMGGRMLQDWQQFNDQVNSRPGKAVGTQSQMREHFYKVVKRNQFSKPCSLSIGSDKSVLGTYSAMNDSAALGCTVPSEVQRRLGTLAPYLSVYTLKSADLWKYLIPESERSKVNEVVFRNYVFDFLYNENNLGKVKKILFSTNPRYIGRIVSQEMCNIRQIFGDEFNSKMASNRLKERNGATNIDHSSVTERGNSFMGREETANGPVSSNFCDVDLTVSDLEEESSEGRNETYLDPEQVEHTQRTQNCGRVGFLKEDVRRISVAKKSDRQHRNYLHGSEQPSLATPVFCTTPSIHSSRKSDVVEFSPIAHSSKNILSSNGPFFSTPKGSKASPLLERRWPTQETGVSPRKRVLTKGYRVSTRNASDRVVPKFISAVAGTSFLGTTEFEEDEKFERTREYPVDDKVIELDDQAFRYTNPLLVAFADVADHELPCGWGVKTSQSRRFTYKEWKRVLYYAASYQEDLATYTSDQWERIVSIQNIQTTKKGVDIMGDFFSHAVPNLDNCQPSGQKYSLILKRMDEKLFTVIFHCLEAINIDKITEAIRLLKSKNICCKRLETNVCCQEFVQFLLSCSEEDSKRNFNALPDDLAIVKKGILSELISKLLY